MDISGRKGGQQFLKEFKTILPGAMLSKVAPATHNVRAMIGTPKWTCGEDISVGVFMNGESGVFDRFDYCVELVTQQANCGGGISPIKQYLTNFAAQNSMGFELTQPPDTFENLHAENGISEPRPPLDRNGRKASAYNFPLISFSK